jgi:hypothetical protein
LDGEILALAEVENRFRVFSEARQQRPVEDRSCDGGLEELASDAKSDLPLKLIATSLKHSEAARDRFLRGCLKESRLSDSGGAYHRSDGTSFDSRACEEIRELPQLYRTFEEEPSGRSPRHHNIPFVAYRGDKSFELVETRV